MTRWFSLNQQTSDSFHHPASRLPPSIGNLRRIRVYGSELDIAAIGLYRASTANRVKGAQMSLNEGFRKMSVKAAIALGSPWLFVANVLLLLVWLGAGPFTGFSDTWQLVVNTATTVFTYLAVFLIQNTQNRDAKAMHLKLDELISSISGARNNLVDLEDLSDAELEKLQRQFKRLREKAGLGSEHALRAIADELDHEEHEEDDEETVVGRKRKTS